MTTEPNTPQSEEPKEAAAEASAAQSETVLATEEAEAPETVPPGEEAEVSDTEAEPSAAPARPERRRRGRPGGRRKVCAFCVEHVEVIDYKDPIKLRRYLSDRGRIEPRRKTGTCAKHQRRLSVALKRARHLALLPYTAEHIRQTGVFAPRS